MNMEGFDSIGSTNPPSPCINLFFQVSINLFLSLLLYIFIFIYHYLIYFILYLIKIELDIE
jgi:hypothetical protein